MERKISIKKLLSLILSAFLAISLVPMPVKTLAKDMPSQLGKPKAVLGLENQVNGALKDNDKMKIIVTLKDNKFSNRLQSQSSKVSKMKETLNSQISVKNKIKSNKIKFNEKMSYSLLLNGFSGETTYQDAKKIAELPEVQSVEAVVEYDAPKPREDVKMSESVNMITAKIAWNLGFKGEGKLISILDSGADVNHKDFRLTNPSKAKYTQAKMNSLISQNMLPGKVFNDKIIYGYNYSDKNVYVKEINGKSGMHGMHVAGTTAANGDINNGGIKGVAPEAQLMIMRVFSEKGGGTSSDIYLKAIEDSTLLGADSINMSLGAPCGTIKSVGQAVINAIKNANAIGSEVNIAAGNEGYFGEGFHNPKADAPDFGVVGTPAVAPPSIAVASINNTHVHVTVAKLSDGTAIGYKESGVLQMQLGKKYEVVYAKLGKVEDFTGLNLSGKLALIERGELNFTDKIKNATNAGAEGVIIFNNEQGGNAFVGMKLEGVTIPAVSIFRDEALKLIENPKTIVFTQEMKPVPSLFAGSMSDFSNWGMSVDQDFKPEITAPGGNIFSTLNDNQYGDMSGTSMATPHVSGGAALVNERVDKDFPNIKGTDKFYLVKNLLMSTAVPHIDPTAKVMTSPRKQGAGVMNLAGATQSKVVVIDPTTKLSKINKKDVSNSFTLNARLVNYGLQKATFTYSTTLQTDEVKDGYFTLKPRLLKTIPGSTVTVEANSTKDITVNVNASEFENELKASMKNGYFLEGFINFKSDVDGELVIPYVGFHGVWDAIPVLEKSIYDFDMKQEKPFYYNPSLMDYTQLYTNLGDSVQTLGYSPQASKEFDGTKIAISPNGDTLADNVSFRAVFLRNYRDVMLQAKDSTGKVLFESFVSQYLNTGKKNHFSSNPKWPKSTGSRTWSWDGTYNSQKVKDGKYTITIFVKPDIENPTTQTMKFDLMVDTVAPTYGKVTYNKTSRVLKVEGKDELSGVRTIFASANGTQIKRNADGSFTIPAGIDPYSVDVEITDYAWNKMKAKLITPQTPEDGNDTVVTYSITSKAVTTDGFKIPSYVEVIKDSTGKVVTNSELKEGTYTVEATQIENGYECTNAKQTVTLTKSNNTQNVTFNFKKTQIIPVESFGSIKINTIKEASFIDLKPIYTVKDSQGNIVTDLNKVKMGTYTVVASNYNGYKVNNAIQTITLSENAKDVTVSFTFTKDVINEVMGKLSFYIFTPYTYNQKIDIELTNKDGKVFKFSYDPTSYVNNKMDLPQGTYTVRLVNLLPGYVSIPATKVVTVTSDYSYVSMDVEKQVVVVKNDISSVKDIASVTKEVGTSFEALALPSNVDVLLDNATVKNLDIKWNNASYNPNKVGSQTLTGELVLPNDGTITNSKNIMAKVIVTLNAKTTLNKEIKEVVKPSEITVPYITYFSSLPLPSKVTVILNDGSKSEVDVTWSSYTYSSYVIGKQEVSGYLSLPYNGTIKNPNYLRAYITVNVVDKEVPVTKLSIKSIKNPGYISVPFGTLESQLNLPKTLAVTLSDGSVKDMEVTWTKVSYDDFGTNGGYYKFKADVVLPKDGSIENPSNITGACTVIVSSKGYSFYSFGVAIN